MSLSRRLILLAGLSFSMFASGQEWQSIQPSGPDSDVGGLVSQMAFVDSGDAYLLSLLGYLHRRSASDQPWSQVPVLLDGESVRLTNLHVGRGDPALLLGQMGLDRLVLSNDGGTTWTELSLPTSGTGVPGWIFGLGSSRGLSDTLYYSALDSLFASFDGGVSWSEQSTSSPRLMYDMQVHPLSPSTLIASSEGEVVLSSDAGSNWAVQSDGIDENHYVSRVGYDPTDLNVFYAAAYNRIYKSVDGAQSFSLMFTGSNNSNSFEQFTVDPNNPSVVYAASGGIGQGSVHRSTDAGLSWSAYTESSGQGSYRRVDVDAKGNVIAAGDQGVVSSSDGVSYQRTNAGFNDFYSVYMAVAPSDNNVMYSCGQAGGVIVTQDGGQSWETRNSGLELSNAWACAVDHGDAMHAFYASNSGLYETTDGALSWSEINVDASQSQSIRSVTVAPADVNRLYVRSSAGLFTSGNGGASWSRILDSSYFEVGGSIIYPVVVPRDEPSTVFVGTYSQGLLKSVDSGATWQALNSGLPNLQVNAIALDRNNAQRIVLGLDDHKVAQSVDGGISWADITYQLPGDIFAIGSAAIDEFNGDIYTLLTRYERVYRLPSGTSEWERVGTVDFEVSNSIQQVIPSNQYRGRLFLQAQEIFKIDFDADSDGVIDSSDNCVNHANADQYDSNSDGFGNRCDADFDNNGVVNFLDVSMLSNAFQSQAGDSGWNPDFDLNNDGVINFFDFSFIPDFFLQSPGPSGLVP